MKPRRVMVRRHKKNSDRVHDSPLDVRPAHDGVAIRSGVITYFIGDGEARELIRHIEECLEVTYSGPLTHTPLDLLERKES